MLREHNEIKEEMKNAENAVKCTIQEQWKLIVPFAEKHCEQKL